MSLATKIETLSKLLSEVLLELAKAKPAAAAAKEEATTKPGRGRPKSKAEPVEELDDELEEGDDLGDDLDEEEDETAYDFKTVRAMLVKLRDHGGAKANAADVKKVMTKFELASANELQDEDTAKLNEVAAFIIALGAKKKIKFD